MHPELWMTPRVGRGGEKRANESQNETFFWRDTDARSTSSAVAFSPYFTVTGRLIFLTCQEQLSTLSVASTLAEQLKLKETEFFPLFSYGSHLRI